MVETENRKDLGPSRPTSNLAGDQVSSKNASQVRPSSHHLRASAENS